MLREVSTEDTGYKSSYTDILNNVRYVKHSIVINDNNKEELKEQMVEELNRIFTHKMN